ncbi:amino acid transporter [Acetobacter aceti NRIC 0242]|uniref:Ethanolamine permease n=1 Tax=Acetobacter aceti NBRC 14818 TaxID=887700 RepID=A0AB33IEU6_ACEAC|nr:ethanolamine permease [Acetobacter aceti]TCS33960.1 ethanolamine:proton symporter (EAT family) [Acetobacter aceti NBRC 14818]BCK76034.1 ethanolamine permease [Acetobacter aceti NBRC 14818]GAN57599.1 amino acid permease [Acetobacter aceti NBRC 14818]GBO79917.1 amino acid transporter [Acetobacter aceti NRIC 0242]
MTTGATKLNKTLSAFHLWGIGVGLVISGEYFGWSYGWGTAGTLGFMVATIFVALMYTSFIFSFTELTTAIPHAGGPFTYSFRALGPLGGLIAGLATLVEFIFAPPAIALAIGAYLNVQFPALSPKVAAVGAYIIFMALNIVGVHIAASFELFVTIAAIIELLVFMGVVAPAFSWDNFIHDGWGVAPHFGLEAMGGIFAAIPFAIWFFLAIEGVAMAAEEAKDPKRSIPVAYIASVLTLVSLAFGVMIFAGGVGDWKALANLNDPLPEAMKRVVGTNSGWLHMLVWLGLFGLVASLHGIIMGYARQIFALARAGFLPAVLGKIHPRFQTPYVATIAGGIVGIAAIFSDDVVSIAGQSLTATLVTMSVFGALTMYILSMISLFVLRRKEPDMERSYRAPLYPILPALALSCAIVALTAVIFYNTTIFLIYIAFIMILSVFFMMRSTKKRLQAS